MLERSSGRKARRPTVGRQRPTAPTPDPQHPKSHPSPSNFQLAEAGERRQDISPLLSWELGVGSPNSELLSGRARAPLPEAPARSARGPSPERVPLPVPTRALADRGRKQCECASVRCAMCEWVSAQ